ncbi:hypothetical protein Tsubulata_007155 [Turnera subulata]|uniref:Protein EXORDIUM-like 2 n=1 Tax=Turnera subulata TaxID=218843 RepID=A0A9Q0FC99_9ROSI|nr:hypothetical protein Tsubulata_007155 [Turnera subulata]
MASCLPNSRLLFSLPSLLLLLLLLLPSSSLADGPPEHVLLTHEGGKLLTGNVGLSLLWYGQFARVQKNAMRTFIKSLNFRGDGMLRPQVSDWWRVVESYQEAAGLPMAPINVQVVKQTVDAGCSVGKVLTDDFIATLIGKALEGFPDAIPVIISAKDVTMQGLCMGKCALHKVDANNKPFIILGNPETECPGACEWPFFKPDYGPAGETLIPPSGNIAADAMVISFASGLAEIVTNPFMDGFQMKAVRNPIEAGCACQGIFGSGAVPGKPGKVLLDPTSGGSYNAYGSKGRKFLIPAIWNPITKSCFTLM